MPEKFNKNTVLKSVSTTSQKKYLYHLASLSRYGFNHIDRLPYSIKILLESAVRNYDGFSVRMQDIQRLAQWKPRNLKKSEVAFKPGRVILQDFTGVPCVVDLAAMRSALKRVGGDPNEVNPQVPCDLVIDHSLNVDAYGSPKAMGINVRKEYQRSKERYTLLKWAQKTFSNFRVIPPATGIIHQVNLEYLALGVMVKKQKGQAIVYPDSLVGTDSHTTMINGIGVSGWGVGGIEAEAVMLGEPLYMSMPEVVGFRLKGRIPENVTATDVVLTVTQMLRKKGVVGKFVEFHGEGLKHLSLPDRATISNMAPEYGATMGIFPVDEETLRYYKATGRSKGDVDLIERYMKAQGMFYDPKSWKVKYSEDCELDLGSVVSSLAGPKRPQDRIPLNKLQEKFQESLRDEKSNNSKLLNHGSVVIAAITSCTNTSNPSVLIGAGLLAQKAVQKGLKSKRTVKTSFAPGSRVATRYLKKAGLMHYYEKLGFHVVGYGCTTCIGNSGPLPEKVAKEITKNNIVAVSVSSGNRNFEGRINPLTKANFLASPMLVVAYALAGTVDINLSKDPIGKDKKGKDVYLKDIWPSNEEINACINKNVRAIMFKEEYKNATSGDQSWKKIKVTQSSLYGWQKKSTYIQEPPFFDGCGEPKDNPQELKGSRVLVMVGDSVTTDHISPAGVIAQNSPAGKYLESQGVSVKNFNSYGSRRGNDRVMTRGTFANIRLRNLLVPGKEGSWSIHFPSKKMMSIFEVAQIYKEEETPLIVLAGKDYGMGSSRDWAAKGTMLLGVRAVIAQSYERIHRSNLLGMGVLPLEFKGDQSAKSLGLKGSEIFDFIGVEKKLTPLQDIQVIAGTGVSKKEFTVKLRLDTPIEIEYYRHGGILPAVFHKLSKKNYPT